MPRKSKRSQVASQRWQRFHDIDHVSTGQADGIPQSSGEVKRSEVSDAVKQGGQSASCQPQVSHADMLKRRRLSESPAAGPSNSEQVNHRGETNDPGVQQVTYADMLKRKLPSVSCTPSPSNSGQINRVTQTDKPFSTQVSHTDTVKRGNHSNYQSVSGSSRVRNVNVVSDSGEQSVCASRSQASLKYGQSRNQQCTCNSLTFLAFLYESEHITRADLDRVLDKGDVMYREVRKTVRDHNFLTTDELPHQVPARRHTQSVDMLQLSRYAASCRYELKPVAFPARESPSALQMNTDVHGNTECDMETEPEPLIDFSQCSVTSAGPDSLAPEMNTTVRDDSHDTSQNVSTLTEKQAHQQGQISNNSVTLKETQEIQSNLTQPLINIPVASDNVLHDISIKLSKLNKEQRKKYKRRLMASEKTSQGKEDKKMKERKKYAKDETYKAKKKSYSSEKYSVNPEIQTKKRQKITTKYRESTDFRLKQKLGITRKYRENVEFKGRQKEYITKKYRENVDFKGRQKDYITKKYRENVDFKGRQKDYITKKYRENVDFKGRQKDYITKKYRENVDFKGRQKDYITKKYRENVDFKGRQKEYIRRKYSEDVNFRQRQRLYVNYRYANDEIFHQRHRQLMRQIMRD
ncbi:uncharacterized protein LOC117832690 isoform X1, partial [Xyrichtys novacula]